MSDTVVVGWVHSPEGQAAVDAAVEEVRRRHGQLLVVHSSRGGRSEEPEEAQDASEGLTELERTLGEQGIRVETRYFARGNDPVDDLLDVAEKEDAALIVIGLRRRSPVGKLLLGSNAQDILLRADRPVLAVKAP